MNQAEEQTVEGVLFTDQYQLTMAQLYFRAGLHEKRVQFDHYFRNYPDYGSHQAGYCISAGLEWLVNWMKQSRFRASDIEHLRRQKTSVGTPVFDEAFLQWLGENGNFDGLSLRAIPEGRVVHGNVPLTVVEGPLAMAQILETSLLNHLNFQTLIATKASRVREAARGRMLLEFGVRRAQGMGANAGTRAALIGGADFSSNVGMSSVLGLPPKGTHAHSMVQLFIALGMGELEAFQAYADTYPDDCLLLVDTINSLESGVPNAIKVFEKLREKGHKPVGIRLDSGDLAYLSIRAAAMLDEAGFEQASIVLSNDLDELVIWQIQTQIAAEASRYGVDPDKLINRLVYGVGTRLITSQGDSALGGVYKLVSVQDGDKWLPALKLSDSPQKIPNPGNKRAWRIYDQRGKANADLLALDDEDPRTMERLVLRHPSESSQLRVMPAANISKIEPLHVDILREGKLVYDLPLLEELRAMRNNDVECLDAGVRRLINPHIYHVSLTQRLYDLKQQLIEKALDGIQ